MTVIACLLAVALVATVHLLLAHFREAQAQWAVERRELLNRIQRPDIVPVTPVHTFTMPEVEPDEIDLVGTIKFEPED